MLRTYVNAFMAYVTRALEVGNAVFVFDRYFDASQSPKSYIRAVRQQKQGTSRVHLLSEDMPAPSRNVILGVTQNKVQLNKMLADALMGLPPETTLHHTLTIAGVEDVPTEIYRGKKIERADLKSEQEEADGIVVQHAIAAALQGQNVRVVSEDTDVWAMLVHFYHTMSITTSLIMSPPSKDRAAIDIGATSAEHSAIAPDLLAIHAISGADTVASYFGIGKGKALKASQKVSLSLSLIGNPSADLSAVLAQGIAFVCTCYGQAVANCTQFTEARIKMWRRKTASGSPKLAALPPTSEAGNENIKRAHLQTAIWKCALKGINPPMSLVKHGWEVEGGQLKPTTVPSDTKLAPDEILKLIRCGCKTGCKRANCLCSNIGCTVFCECEGGVGVTCLNPLTVKPVSTDSDDEGEE